MKRRSHSVGLGLACVLLLAAGCGEGNENGALTPTNPPAVTLVPTQTPTPIGASTPTKAPTNTAIPTLTPTPASTLTPTTPPTITAIPTQTPTPSRVATPTETPSMTSIPSATPTPTNTSAPTDTPTNTATPTQTPTATNVPGQMTGRLDLDIRWSADVEIRVTGPDLTAKVTLSDAREVAVAGVALEGTGNVHAFPEADAVLYTARLASPPVAAGRCGSEPVSLALTLLRRGTNGHVAGGIAVYCGANTYAGNPARMLRLAGVLPIN